MTETVGARIQRIATAKGLGKGTVRGIAAAVGVHYETLRKWTRGITAPHWTTAEEVADVLGVSAEVVMFGGDQAVADSPPLAPDARALAEAFDRLPVDSHAAIETRARLYAMLLGLIELHAHTDANTPAPAPGGPTSRQVPGNSPVSWRCHLQVHEPRQNAQAMHETP